jgi:hypothetical protein
MWFQAIKIWLWGKYYQSTLSECIEMPQWNPLMCAIKKLNIYQKKKRFAYEPLAGPQSEFQASLSQTNKKIFLC